MTSQYVDDHQRVKESGLLAEATVGRSTASMIPSDRTFDIEGEHLVYPTEFKGAYGPVSH
jgi:hypothetical protein